MNKIKYLLDYVLERLLITLMASMVMCITWQIISRYLLATPSTWTEELARYLLIWIGMFGAAYAFSAKMHLGIDLLLNSLSGARKQALLIITALVCGAFALFSMVIGGMNLVQLTWDLNQISPALGIKIAWIYAAIPASGLLICFYSAFIAYNPKDEA